ncbi:hypothetical protein EOD39_20516 [Acipenser ruthenus]|uniref:Uncharacterized protein n=1 Tax=Acipenser ruthenus TaxID=7906 RepID=A0A444UV91_ACIRT|nr:hypothetical protein EOD39_20516 [Acipenser ruthenus]
MLDMSSIKDSGLLYAAGVLSDEQWGPPVPLFDFLAVMDEAVPGFAAQRTEEEEEEEEEEEGEGERERERVDPDPDPDPDPESSPPVSTVQPPQRSDPPQHPHTEL